MRLTTTTALGTLVINEHILRVFDIRLSNGCFTVYATIAARHPIDLPDGVEFALHGADGGLVLSGTFKCPGGFHVAGEPTRDVTVTLMVAITGKATVERLRCPPS